MRIINVEQRSEEWLESRTGVITGTRLKSAFATDPKSLIYELIAERLAPAKESVATESMERGAQLEEDALVVWESATGYTATTIGFVLHDTYDWLGCSPDALVQENGKYVGAVEVKCPDTKTHVKYMVENKIPSEYKYQVLNYFLVCDTIEWLDFVSYDPRIESEDMQLVTVRVTREELQEELDDVTQKLLAFRKKWEAIEETIIF